MLVDLYTELTVPHVQVPHFFQQQGMLAYRLSKRSGSDQPFYPLWCDGLIQDRQPGTRAFYKLKQSECRLLNQARCIR